VNKRSSKRSRIIVALDSIDPRDVALEIARHLHRATAYEFLGLFVEDTYILNHAQSRLAKEVMLSGLERPLQRSTLERQLRAQSTQIRQQFEAAASQLGLFHSFRVARGELVAELVQQAQEAEALVISLTKNSPRLNELVGTAMERLSEAPLPLLLLAREGWFSGQCIVVLVADPDIENAVLQTAAGFAKQSRSPLKIILTGEALAQREACLPEIARNVHAEGVDSAEVIAMKTLSGSAIAQIARTNHARLLVVPSSSPVNLDLIAEMSKNLSSALMIIRS
jgi:nucleotide-binding universal stress UspA family protein